MAKENSKPPAKTTGSTRRCNSKLPRIFEGMNRKLFGLTIPNELSAPVSMVANSRHLVTGGIAWRAADRLAPWFTLRAFIAKLVKET